MTRHLVDPELLTGLELLPDLDIDITNLARLRTALHDLLPPPETHTAPGVAIERLVAPGPEGAPPVPLIVCRPSGVDHPLPLLLNIHGGGYVLGAAADTTAGDAAIAIEVGCAVASVEYRLAPEVHAPAPLEDCYAALSWLYRNADALSLDAGRFAVGGQSAGGGLAAALALLARDRAEVPLCFQLLIYPMLDDRTVTREPIADNPWTGEFIWTRQSNAFGWQALLGRQPGGPGVSPYAAAARAEDLTNLPATYICVGALDLFLEEDVAYAQRLMQAGVATELHVLPGAYHGFELVPDAAVSAASLAERRTALASAFARGRDAANGKPIQGNSASCSR